MAKTITKVALAGSSGKLSSNTLAALRGQGFKVTVLSRTPRECPADVTVQVVEFSSTESLSAALKEIPGISDMPVWGRKRESYRALKEKAEKYGMTYTLIICGCFLTATLFDDGTNVVPYTTLEDAGKATAGVLVRPEETRNRLVYVHNMYLSQVEILEVVQEVTGKDDWRTVKSQEMKPLFDRAMEDLRTGNITPTTFVVQIQFCIANKSLTHPWEQDHNELGGIKAKTKEELGALVRQLTAD